MSNKIQRNDPCPCGSRKKFKKCCGLPPPTPVKPPPEMVMLSFCTSMANMLVTLEKTLVEGGQHKAGVYEPVKRLVQAVGAPVEYRLTGIVTPVAVIKKVKAAVDLYMEKVERRQKLEADNEAQ